MSTSLRILGIDPGTRLTGYGIIDYRIDQSLRPELVDGGVLRFDEKQPLRFRLVELERELDELITGKKQA